MKNVLVTGADGFIGSHLAETLVRRGYKVRAMVLYNSFDSWGWLDESPREIKDAIEVVAGDVRDSGFVRTAVKGQDAVMHLAALIAIPYSYIAPQSYVDVNVTGTLNVVSAAKDFGIAKVVHTSNVRVLWHRAVRADHGRTPAGGPIAVRGEQDWRGSDRAVVPSLLRGAGDRGAAVQHLWTATVGARGDSDRDQPDCRRQDRDRAWRVDADPRLQFRAGHRGRDDRDPEREEHRR